MKFNVGETVEFDYVKRNGGAGTYNITVEEANDDYMVGKNMNGEYRKFIVDNISNVNVTKKRSVGKRLKSWFAENM